MHIKGRDAIPWCPRWGFLDSGVVDIYAVLSTRKKGFLTARFPFPLKHQILFKKRFSYADNSLYKTINEIIVNIKPLIKSLLIKHKLFYYRQLIRKEKLKYNHLVSNLIVKI